MATHYNFRFSEKGAQRVINNLGISGITFSGSLMTDTVLTLDRDIALVIPRENAVKKGMLNRGFEFVNKTTDP